MFSDRSNRKCPARVKRLLCRKQSSFHSELELLSSGLWGANPAPSTMKTFANQAIPGDERIGSNACWASHATTRYCRSEPRLRTQARVGVVLVETGSSVHADIDNCLERSAT